MVVLIVCLVASIAIAIVRLTTTPMEILGDGFRGLSAQQADAYLNQGGAPNRVVP
jgi:hypothetical protein